MRTITVTLLFLVALIIEIHGQIDESGRAICESKIPATYMNSDGSLKLPHQTNPFLRTKREITEQSDEPQKKQICEPGSRTEVDCNTCTCSLDGTALGCTRMACPKIPAEFLNPDGSLKLPHQSNPILRTKREIIEQSDEPQKKQICEPGSWTKVDCNTCTCSLDGTALGCTRMACPKMPAEFLNPDGSLKLPHQNNPILRTKRGNHNIRYEPINIRRQRDAPIRCVPGSTWQADCNRCFCSADGRNAGCTLMACPPKKSFQSELNSDPVIV